MHLKRKESKKKNKWKDRWYIYIDCSIVVYRTDNTYDSVKIRYYKIYIPSDTNIKDFIWTIKYWNI